MLLPNLNLLATAPGGVARLRELILTLAVQGKLVPQDPSDEPAGVLLQKIRAEKDRLIAEGKIRRDKPLAEIADEEKPFGLPPGWEWVKLGQLSEIKGGKRLPAGHSFADEKTPYAYIQVTNMKAGTILTENLKYLKPETQASIRNYTISQDDLYITIAGTIGQVGEVPVECHFMNLTENAAKIVFQLLNKRWLREVLNSQICQSQFIEKTVQQAQPKLALHRIADSLIPLPPLAEQSRIVARVEELMRLCDALEAKGRLEAAQHAQLVSTLLGTLTDSDTPEALARNWQRIATHFDVLLDRPQAVDAFEQIILQLAVRGLLVPQEPGDEPASVLLQKIRAEKDRLILEGKIRRDKPLPPIAEEEKPFQMPQGWKWIRLGNLVNASEAGWSPTCIGSPRREGFWGVLKVSAVSWGAFDEDANKELPDSLSPRPEYEVKERDFLLSRANTEELVARSVVVDTVKPQLMLSDKIIRLDVSSLMNRMFLNFSNNASHSRAHYITHASGTSSSMKNVSREVVLKTPVPLPPQAEQSRIVARVQELRRLCAELRQRLSASQTAQAHLAEALVEGVAA